MAFQPHFAAACSAAEGSAISALLKYAARPGMISFGGGLPAPEAFPLEAMKRAYTEVINKYGSASLQYSQTEGVPQLREAIARRETENGIPTEPDEVQILSGSQQGLDMLGRVFVDEGSKVLVESPTYLGTISALAPAHPTYVTIPTDGKGMLPGALGSECEGARFAYVMPNYANPTGLTIDNERRAELAAKARQYGFVLFEDDPYGELWYEEPHGPSLRTYAPELTVRSSSMSKILSPGLRLGYITGPKEILSAFTRVKQTMDINSSTINQFMAAAVLDSGIMPEHLARVRKLYSEHCRVMLESLEEYFPQGCTWSHPKGGMFLWLRLPEGVDTVRMMMKAIEANVLYVPGEQFYAGSPERNTLRLSYVTVSPDKIRAGIKALAAVVREEIDASAR